MVKNKTGNINSKRFILTGFIIVVSLLFFIFAIIVALKISNKGNTYVESLSLQDINDSNICMFGSFHNGKLIQYMVPGNKSNPAEGISYENGHSFLFYDLANKTSESVQITDPSALKEKIESLSEGEYTEDMYAYKSISITNEYIFLSFVNYRFKRKEGVQKGKIQYINPVIYMYSLDGEYIRDFSLEDSESLDAILIPSEGNMVCDDNYLYIICQSDYMHSSKEITRRGDAGDFNPENAEYYLAVYNFEGDLLKTDEVSGKARLTASLYNGAILQDGKKVVFFQGTQSKNVKNNFKDSYVIQSSDSKYDFLYLKDYDVFGYDIDSAKSKRIIKSDQDNIANMQITVSGTAYYYNDKIYNSYNNAAFQDMLVVLNQGKDKNSNKNVEKKLRIACIGTPTEGRLNQIFRAKHPDYEVEFVEFENEGQFLEAIGKGEQIDIVNLGGLDENNLIEKNLLEDYYLYIENETSLSKDDFIPEVMNVFEADGSLYEATSGYFPLTVLAFESVLTDKKEWNYETLNSIMQDNPKEFYREEVLDYAYVYMQDELINGKNCDFTIPGFVEVFENSKKYRSMQDIYGFNDDENVDWIALLEKRKFVKTMVSYTDLAFLSDYNKNHSEKIIILGQPTKEGNVSFYAESVKYGILSSSNEKEVAWDWVKPLFSKDYQLTECYMNGFFPTRKDVLAELNTIICATDSINISSIGEISEFESNTAFGYSYPDLKWGAADLSEVEKNEKDLQNASKYNGSDMIYGILREEADAYWIGSKNAKDCLDVVNSRVKIYLGE